MTDGMAHSTQGNAYGIIKWDYPQVKSVDLPPVVSRAKFPKDLEQHVLNHCEHGAAPIFSAFDLRTDSKNTAIGEINLQYATDVFLGIRQEGPEESWEVYRLDPDRISESSKPEPGELSKLRRIGISNDNFKKFCNEEDPQPLLRWKNGGNAQ